MASENEIKIIVKAEVDKAKKDLSSVKASAKDAGGGMAAAGKAGAEGMAQMGGQTGIVGNVISKLPGPVKIAAVAIGAVVGAVVAFVAVGSKFADIAAAQEQALAELSAIAKATGNNFDEVKDAAKELSSDGLMTFQESASALSNLLATGMNLPKAIQLLETAKDNAITNRQANYELGESVVTFTEGMRNENSMLTDSVGIQKNYSKILEEGAKSMGRTVESLSAREKAQIVANGFIKEGAAFEGQAAKAADTYAGAKARSDAAVKSLSISIGQVFMPAMKSVKNAMAEAAENTRTWIDSLRGAERELSKAEADKAKLGALEKQIAAARAAETKAQEEAFQRIGEKESLWNKGEKFYKKQAENATAFRQELENQKTALTVELTRRTEAEKRLEIISKIRAKGAEPVESVATPKTKFAPAGKRETTAAELQAQLDAVIVKEELAAARLKESSALIAEATKNTVDGYDDLIKKAIEYKLIAADPQIVTNKRLEVAANKQSRDSLQEQVNKVEAKKKAEEEYTASLAKAAALGITLTETDKATTEGIKTRISEYENYEAKRKALIDEAKQLSLLAEGEITKETNKQIEDRIKAYKRFKDVFSATMAGIKDIGQASFEFDKQLRDQKLADDIHAIEVARDASIAAAEATYNAEIESIQNANEYNDQITEMEKERARQKQAERDADLAAQKARLEDELASAIGTEEKKRIEAEITAVNKQIADENYQKNLDALKEAAKVKQEKLDADAKTAKEALDKARAKSEKEYEDTVKALKREAFEADKTAKIAQAIMNGAMAVTMTFATGGFLNPAAWVAAAAGAITTGIQVAAISSQKFPEYRTGSEYISRDQMAILHEGERVLTKAENKTYNTGGMTINLYGVNDPESLQKGIDDYLKRNGGFALEGT